MPARNVDTTKIKVALGLDERFQDSQVLNAAIANIPTLIQTIGDQIDTLATCKGIFRLQVAVGEAALSNGLGRNTALSERFRAAIENILVGQRGILNEMRDNPPEALEHHAMIRDLNQTGGARYIENGYRITYRELFELYPGNCLLVFTYLGYVG